MVSITDELIEALKKHKFSIPVKDVRDPFSTKEPTYPMITVDESINRTTLQLHGEEIHSRISYRFEIYSRDMSQDDKVYSKRQVNTIIGNELDEFMRTKYGMKRIGNPRNIPSPYDDSVLRYVITYNGTIDNRTMIIYQN